MSWPNDADGDALRRLETDGFNFQKEHDIDFNIDFDHWPLSDTTISAIKNLYPNSEFIDPGTEDIESGDNIGYVQFRIFGKVTYDLVIRTQEKVTAQMQQFGGWCESWGVMCD